jgi:hypothetical protein
VPATNLVLDISAIRPRAAYACCSSSPKRRNSSQADSQAIAGRIVQILAHAQIPLSGNDAGVAERELNLLERGASFMREFRKSAAEVVGGEFRHADLPAVFYDGLQDVLRQQD